MRQVFGVYSTSVVGHSQHQLIIFAFSGNINLPVGRGELYGIGNKVVHHTLNIVWSKVHVYFTLGRYER